MTTIRFKEDKVEVPHDLILSPEQQIELLSQLLYVERQCPCGARPEALHTHPHVGGCGIDFLIRQIYECTGVVP